MILIHLAEGFEEIEALTVIDILRRSQLEAFTVSVTGDKWVEGAHSIKIAADYVFEEIDYEKCDMIVLPGGLTGAYGLRDHKGLIEQIIKFNNAQKSIGAICAAPLVLGFAGVLQGKRATIYPGMEAHLIDAIPVREKVVTDKNVITSHGPATAMAFALAIVAHFAGVQKADQLRKDLLLEI